MMIINCKRDQTLCWYFAKFNTYAKLVFRSLAMYTKLKSNLMMVLCRGEHRVGSVGFGPKMVHPEKTESVKSWPITDHFKFRFCWVSV
jgi:hypothetical protein